MALFTIFNDLISFLLSLEIMQYLYSALSLVALFGIVRRLL